VERLRERLTDHTLIGLDTCIFVHHLAAHSRCLPLTQDLLTGTQAGEQAAITSTVTVTELTGHPWQLDQPAVARQYEALLAHFPHLTLADVTRDVARRAAQLRARYCLRPAEALQVATALVHGATAFVSNDRGLALLAPLLDIIILDDFGSAM